MTVIITSGVGVFASVSIYKREEKFFEKYLMPLVHRFPPEMAHKIGVQALKYNLFQKQVFPDPDRLVSLNKFLLLGAICY